MKTDDNLLPGRSGHGDSATTAIGTITAVGAGGTRLRCDPSALVTRAVTVGGHLKIRSDGRWLLAGVRDTGLDADGSLSVTVDLLGESRLAAADAPTEYTRGITHFPCPGDRAHCIGTGDLAGLGGPTGPAGALQGDLAGRRRIAIGTVHPTDDVIAGLDIDSLLGKHFALLGSTGSGKSTATALILHRLIAAAPHGHVIILDPHGEYGRAFAESGVVFTVTNLALPYWLMNFDEHCEVFVSSEGAEGERERAILAGCLLAARSRSIHAAGIANLTVDSPVPYLIFELVAALDAHMGKLDHAAEIARHVRLKNRIDEVLREPRYRFMFDRTLNADSLADFLARILRLDSGGRPLAVIDLSGMPSDMVSVIVALLARIVMDHAVWAQDDNPRPVLLVCEEAHRYIPATASAPAATHLAPARRALERIAKEGRKYGVALALVSQRPSDLAEGALSQCGTLIAMRLNNEADQACVRNAMPEGGRGLLDAVPALRRGEAIICGEGVALPMRVRFDHLPEAQRPRSDDPSFGTAWQQPAPGDGGLARTIARWRNQSDARGSAPPAPASLLRQPEPGAGPPRPTGAW